jgi:hypothetical protein
LRDAPAELLKQQRVTDTDMKYFVRQIAGFDPGYDLLFVLRWLTAEPASIFVRQQRGGAPLGFGG